VWKCRTKYLHKFCFKSKKTQRKRINYSSKHTVKMQWVIHKCLTGSVDLKRVEPPLKTTPVREDRFLILRVSYTTSTLQTGKQLTRNSTWSSYDVCVNQFAENDRKNGEMATGSCTTSMRLHTLHILCSGFSPNTAPLSCSSRHTHRISHCVTFFCSQGLRKFWKDTDLRQRKTSNKIRQRHYYTSRKRSSQIVSNSVRNVGWSA